MKTSFRWLSVNPRIEKVDDKLVGWSSWQWSVMSLGSHARRVIVDPVEKLITIRRKVLWFRRRTRKIPFSAVEAIVYGYEDWAYTTILDNEHTSSDWYSVGLRLYNGDEVGLFRFHGRGPLMNDSPWPTWFFEWDDYIQGVTGTQAEESRLYAELLSRMIDVSIVPPR